MTLNAKRSAHGHLSALRNKMFDPHGAYPHFAGSITLPDTAQPRQVSLWVRRTDDGPTFVLGRVLPPASEMLSRLATGDPASAAKTKLGDIPQDFQHLDPKPREIILVEHECRGCGTHHYRGYYNPGNGNAYALSLDTHVQVDGELSLSADVTPCDVQEMATWFLRTHANPPIEDDEDEEPQRKKGRGR